MLNIKSKALTNFSHLGFLKWRFLVVMVFGLMWGMAALAANPSDWWVHIANDRAESVRSMLARGADPNALSDKGQPAIMQAVRDNAWTVYDVLAAHPKTKIEIVNANGETPLMYLAVVGQTQRAQALIKRGAQVNRLGWTPLQYAASKGHLDTVKMLIANKAMVNAPGPDGTTALMMAAYDGNEEVIRYLLAHGADATMVNLQQLDAADWAREKGNTALAKQLDVLTSKVLARRAAQRQSGDDPAQAIINLDDVDAVAAPAKKSDPQSGQDHGTSRYFDLDRFNEPSEP